MFDVCLIYLPKPYLKQPDAQAPLGIMYVAAALEQAGKTVCIKNYASFDYLDAIIDLPKAKVYGITATSLEVPDANDFGKMIKILNGAHVIMGGPGSYSTEFIDYDCIDSVVQGEGENIIFKILDDIDNDCLSPLYVASPIEDLDSLPYPSRHLLKDKQGGNIFAFGQKYAEGDSTIIVSSRGCPFHCAFCSAPKLTHGKKIRFREPKEVVKEIEFVRDTYGIRQFRFSDDMFTASRKNVIEFCRLVKPLDVFWRISCRVNPFDREMAQAMFDSGCKELSFGIESFDDTVLGGLNKSATAEMNKKALELANEIGFKTRVLFMIATPFQTPETIEKNKKFIDNTPFDIIACTQFLPIPGCDIWYNPDKYNVEILNRNLKDYNFYMYGPDGRRPIQPIIKIKDRPLKEFLDESEEFRDWLEKRGVTNEG